MSTRAKEISELGNTGFLELDANGNLGIGVSDPDSKLEVQSTAANFNSVHFANTNNQSYGLKSLGGGNTATRYIADFRDYNNATAFKIDGDANVIQTSGSPEYHFATTNATHFNWRIAAQEVVDAGFEIASGTQVAGSSAATDTYTPRLVIKADGKIGIGATSPDTNLQVGDGTSAVNLLLFGPNSTTTSSELIFGDNVSSPFGAPYYSGMSIRFDTNINKLQIRGHNSETSSPELVTIERATGNVGIGTTSPSALLHVDGDVIIDGSSIKLPTGTSNPSNPVVGSTYFNTSTSYLNIYDGSLWGQVRFSAIGAANNPAVTTSQLAATGPLTQYYFDPMQTGSPYQLYAAGGVASLGTIPTGGPSWVYDHNSIVLVEKGQIGTSSQYKMTQAQYLDFFEQSMTDNGGTSLYVYWAVFDGSTLWGITRTRWTGATYSSWASGHNSNGSPSGTATWDAWKTGYASSGGIGGSYTVSQDSNMVRSVLPQQSYNGGSTSYGIHYKRLDDGEHYPWRDSSGNYVDNGYFRPSTSYSMLTDSRYVHYIYLSDT